LKDLRKAGELLSGFKVVGRISGDEVTAFEPQIAFLIKERKERPIGLLADLSQMEGADWKARWNEMRFLQKYTDHIARMAVVGADKWEGSGGYASRRNFCSSGRNPLFPQLQRWLLPGTGFRSSKNADHVPIRRMYLGTGLVLR